MNRDLKHRLMPLAVAFMAAVLMVVDLSAFPRIESANAAGAVAYTHLRAHET